MLTRAISTSSNKQSSDQQPHHKEYHMSMDPGEAAHFRELADQWWDRKGSLSGLHSMNELRVPWVRDALKDLRIGTHNLQERKISNMALSAHPCTEPPQDKPLAGYHLLDVGCGGGLLSEPFARLGARVLGIDMLSEAINVAQKHALDQPDETWTRLDELPSNPGKDWPFYTPMYGKATVARPDFQTISLEDLNRKLLGDPLPNVSLNTATSAKDFKFDAIIASEVLEHIDDWREIVTTSKSLLKPGGSLFITTINRTRTSYALAIVMAEYVMKRVPLGTHSWEKFITPFEMQSAMVHAGLQTRQALGFTINPLTNRWSWCDSLACNYAMHAVFVPENSNH